MLFPKTVLQTFYKYVQHVCLKHLSNIVVTNHLHKVNTYFKFVKAIQEDRSKGPLLVQYSKFSNPCMGAIKIMNIHSDNFIRIFLGEGEDLYKYV